MVNRFADNGIRQSRETIFDNFWAGTERFYFSSDLSLSVLNNALYIHQLYSEKKEKISQILPATLRIF